MHHKGQKMTKGKHKMAPRVAKRGHKRCVSSKAGRTDKQKKRKKMDRYQQGLRRARS